MEKRCSILLDNIDPLIQNINIVVDKHESESILKIISIVKTFIKEHKLIIYGGRAIDKAISEKNKKDGIYYSLQPFQVEIKDYDVYTPSHVEHSILLSNICYDKGYKETYRVHALHGNTYRIYVNHQQVIDFTYIPKELFTKLEFFTKNGLRYIDPQYQKIDLYTALTSPCRNVFRWTKDYPRLIKLEHYYPILTKKITTKINHYPKIKTIISKIISLLKTQQQFIISGILAANEITGVSTLPPYIEIYSVKYLEITKSIFDKLMPNKHIVMYKYYKMLDHLPQQSIIYYDKIPIFHGYQIVPKDEEIVSIKINGKDIDNFYHTLKHLYARRFYSLNKDIVDVAIINMLEYRNSVISKTKKLYINDSTSPIGILLYPSFRDVCILANAKNCQAHINVTRGADEEEFMKKYIPDKGRITKVSIPPFIENLKILGENIID